MRLPFGGKKQAPVVPRRRLSEQPPRDDSHRVTEAQASAAKRTFRRNRTLTGTTSGNIQSATEATGLMQSPRATAHHLRRQRRYAGSMLLAVITGIVAVGALLLQFTAEVRVAVVGQVRPMTEDQQQRIIAPIESYLANRPLERIRVILNKDNLGNYLQAEGVRDIEAVHSIAADGLGASVVTVKVREPVARWAIAGQERFVDKSGVIFSVNYFDTPSVSIRDDSGLSVQSEAETRAVTSSRFLAFIGRSVGLVKGHGIDVDSVVIPPNTTRQVDLVLSDGSTAVPARMIIDRPAGEQAEDAARAYRHLAGQSRLPQYIDVRVSGMAYYRPR